MFFLLGKSANSAIRKLTARSIQADKRRNRFVITTILLAVALMVFLSLYNLGVSRETKLYLQGRYQASFIKSTDNIFATLKNNEQIEMIGKEASLGTERVGDYTLDIYYKDSNALKLKGTSNLLGRMPEKKNEVVVEQAYLENINMPIKLNQKILLNIPIGEKQEFTICGIIPNSNTSRIYKILISEALYNQYDKNGSYDILISLKNATNIDSETLKMMIEKIAKQSNVPSQYVMYSSTYFGLSEEKSTVEVIVIVLASIFIIFACSLVIYSIFYISSIEKTQEYGRLKVIGATQKQIRCIVQKEGLRLSIVAIPVGIVVGCILGYFTVPNGWSWITTYKCIVIIAMVTEIALLIAIHAPAKKASKISPIEALRINEIDTIPKVNTKRARRKITPYSLAKMNFNRNKRKALLTLISLGISGVLLMCVATYTNSIDVKSMAKQQFPKGDIMISLNPLTVQAKDRAKDFNNLQVGNPLNENMEKSILGIEGVKKIEYVQGCISNMKFPVASNDGNNHFFSNIGIPKDQYTNFSRGLIEGTADHQKLIKGKGVIVDNSEKLLTNYYQYTPKIGDIIEVQTDTGIWKEFTVMGICEAPTLGVATPIFFFPEELLCEIKGNVTNFNMNCFIDVEDKLSDVEKQIFDLMQSNGEIEISSISDVMMQLKSEVNKIKIPLYCLVLFVAVFGVINMINTLMTNIISRQQEFAILQAIGLTNKQFVKILQTECLYYIVETAIITLTFGTFAGYILCTVFNQVGTLGTLHFSFPILQVSFYFIALVFMAGAYSFFVIRYVKKGTLVERIKTIE